jgi:hypothetical protein
MAQHVLIYLKISAMSGKGEWYASEPSHHPRSSCRMIREMGVNVRRVEKPDLLGEIDGFWEDGKAAEEQIGASEIPSRQHRQRMQVSARVALELSCVRAEDGTRHERRVMSPSDERGRFGVHEDLPAITSASLEELRPDPCAFDVCCGAACSEKREYLDVDALTLDGEYFVEDECFGQLGET